MADRAMTPVVSKALEAIVVVLYIGLVTASLYGGAVPEYRTAAGEEVAERTLSNAATDIEDTIPPATVAAEIRTDVTLPPTIAGSNYRIYAESGQLVLEHSNPEISTEVPLVVSNRTVAVSGQWESGGSPQVRVLTVDGGIEVRLE